MKKILLVTIQDQGNFGNRLQNYALKTVLEKMGFEVDVLTVIKNFGKKPIIEAKLAVKRILVKLGQSKYNQQVAFANRKRACIAFTKKHFPNRVYADRQLLDSMDWSAYDFAVTGSDQVWHHWKSFDRELEYYYLEFMPQEKRISYAPSFGFNEFPAADIEQHRKGLQGMKTLSCREQEGCALIYSLTGRDSFKALDPTMLLSTEEWASLEKKPGFIDSDKYLLRFFIGRVSDESQKEIDRIASAEGLKVVDIGNKQDPLRYGISPENFIWLIHHAEVVCTDSFHAGVFSILFGRKLRVFRRVSQKYGDMFGRFNDLLTPLDLMDVVFGIGDSLSTQLSEKAKDYIPSERARCLDYLARCFDIPKDGDH